MSKRVLAVGAGLAVLAMALLAVLALLDVITLGQLRESFPRLLGVVGILTIAVLLMLGIGHVTRKK